MRKGLTLALIMLISTTLPLGQIDHVDAQMNPYVAISCDTPRPIVGNGSHDYSNILDAEGIELAHFWFTCTLSNPTLYYQNVSLGIANEWHTRGYDVVINESVIINPGENTQFKVRVYKNNLSSYAYSGSFSVEISARVTGATTDSDQDPSESPCWTCSTEISEVLLIDSSETTLVEVNYTNEAYSNSSSSYHGQFILEMLSDHAPFHVRNFVVHVIEGNYENVRFHRVIDDFMIQGGDFENADGTGGYAAEFYGYCDGEWVGHYYDTTSCESQTQYTIPDEADNGMVHNSCTISMAKTSNPNTGGSQFFLIPEDSSPNHLDGVHTVFGQIISGCENITSISEVPTGTMDQPIQNVTITSMHLLHSVETVPEPDSDGDGTNDSSDAFPQDANETHDDDGDGVGNNSDAFPQDANETHDDDGDGVGNNSDAFPQDANETMDTDGDGVGDNSDAFPQDVNETMDTDGDGVGDNSDADPDDPDVRVPADIQINVTDNSIYVLAFAILTFAAVLVFVRRRPPPSTSTPFVTEGDSIWNDV